jgi:hypothetical protein
MGGLRPYDVIPAGVATLVLLIAVGMRLRGRGQSGKTGAAMAVASLAILWIRMDFGAHTLLSGADYFLRVFAPPAIDTSAAGPFVAEMSRIGMYDLIKVVEVIAGLMIVLNVFTPLALILEFPITVSIFWLSVVVVGVGRPVFTGWRELLFNAVLFAAYAGYYLPMLDPQARQRPLWDRGVFKRLTLIGRPAGAAEAAR